MLKLTNEGKETCDKPITESENVSSGKTPGSDALPINSSGVTLRIY